MEASRRLHPRTCVIARKYARNTAPLSDCDGESARRGWQHSGEPSSSRGGARHRTREGREGCRRARARGGWKHTFSTRRGEWRSLYASSRTPRGVAWKSSRPACPQLCLQARHVKIEAKKLQHGITGRWHRPTVAVLGRLGQAMQRRSCATRVREMDECAMARIVPRARAHLKVKSAPWLQPRRPRKRACVRVLQKGLSLAQPRKLC